MSDGTPLDSVLGTRWVRERLCIIEARIKNEPPAQQRVILISLFALAALSAHLVFLLVLPAHWRANQSSDFAMYYGPLASNLVGGEGFVLRSKAALQYPPGIPLLYAAAFWFSDALAADRGLGLRILQAGFVVCSGVLVGLTAMRVFSLRVAVAASLLWSTYPLHLWLTKQPDASAALTSLLLLAVCLFLLWSVDSKHPVWYGLAVGGILAIAALIKPFSIALPAVFVCLVWACEVNGQYRQRGLFSLCVVIAYVLLISPWEIWAWRASGYWIPLCTNGPNALIDGLTFGTVRGLKPIPMPGPVRVLTQDAVAHYPSLKTTSSIARFLLARAQSQPVSVIELFLLKAIRSWYGSESQGFEGAVAVIQLCYIPLVILGLRKALRGGRAQRNFVLVTLSIFFYFWAMTVVTALPIVRYLVPSFSLLLICAAAVFDKSAVHEALPSGR